MLFEQTDIVVWMTSHQFNRPYPETNIYQIELVHFRSNKYGPPAQDIVDFF